jgi:signal peptidase I
MPRRLPDEDDEESEGLWKGLARDLLVAGIIVILVLVGIYAYTGVWPPLVVVESRSMQHSGTESSLGVIDTGDMVFQQAAPTRADVVTYLEGRASGYATYGDFGDVIIFRHGSDPTPVIHRAIMYITIHSNGTADVPNLALLTGWEAISVSGPISCPPTCSSPSDLRSVTIHGMGFRHNLGITFDFSRFLGFAPRSGYITMGDYNAAFISCASPPFDPCAGTPYDTQWLPVQQDIVGRARGEIPWFGLLKLTLGPTTTCCTGWGDREAPTNSWDSLAVSLVVLFALPFILEYAARGWKKYVSPKLPEIRWPWQRAKTNTETRNPGEDQGGSSENPRHRRRKPPREESSGP